MLSNRLLALSFLILLGAMDSQMLHAQWVQTHTPIIATANCFLPFGDSLFVGTNNGILLSTSYGKWIESNQGVPADAEVYYLARCGANIFANAYPYGLFCSSDRGTTWNEKGNFKKYQNIAITAADSVLFVVSDSGIERSTDGGVSWTSPELAGDGVNSIIASHGNIVASANHWNFYHSTDYGNTWVEEYIPYFSYTPPLCFAFMDSAVVVGTDSGIFISGASVPAWPNNYLSWQRVGVNLGTVYSIATMPSKIFAVTGRGVFLSTDTGQHWEKTGFPSVATLTISDSTILGGTEFGGAFESRNYGNDYTYLGLARTGDWDAIASNTRYIFYTSEGCGVSRSSDSGMTWTVVSAGLGDISLYALFSYDSSLFAGTFSGIFRSTDNGASWKQSLPSQWIVCFSAYGGDIYAGSNDSGVFHSDDGGQSWNRINIGLKSLRIMSLACDSSHVWSGTVDSGIFLSTNKGKSWTASLHLPYTSINALTIIGTTIIAGTGQGIFYSSDNGQNWTQCLPYISGDPFMIIGSNVFACSSGISLSKDNGIAWSDESVGLPTCSLCYPNSLALFQGSLFAAVRGYDSLPTLWRRPLSEMIGTSIVETTPVRKNKLNIYPNPLTHSTTISFTPAASGYADVSIVNPLGVEVAHLFSGEVDAGNHSFIWNSAGIPMGTYECVVRMNGQVETLPVVVR